MLQITTTTTQLIISKETVSEVDKIINKMSKNERKRSAASILDGLWGIERRMFKDRQSELETLRKMQPAKAEGACQGCTNCGETDSTRFQLTDDKAEVVCGGCGACFKRAKPKSNSFEKNPRADLRASHSASFADGIEDSAGRTAARMNELDTTTVKGPLKNAQLSIQRAAIRQDIQEIQKLTRGQSSKRDRVIVEIHKHIRSIGRDPDTCVVCGDASSIANTLFVKCAMHQGKCMNTDQRCKFSAIGASKSAIALESIRQALDRATDEDSQTLAVLGGVAAVKCIESKLSSILQHYIDQRSVSEFLRTRVGFVLDCSDHAVICNPCPDQTAVEAEVPAVEADAPAVVEDEPSYAVDIDMQRLQLSIQSISAIGYADASIVESALQYSVTPECHEWLHPLKSWPIDLLAMMIVFSLSDHKPTKLLKKVSKRFQVSFETVTEKLMLISHATSEASGSVA